MQTTKVNNHLSPQALFHKKRSTTVCKLLLDSYFVSHFVCKTFLGLARDALGCQRKSVFDISWELLEIQKVNEQSFKSTFHLSSVCFMTQFFSFPAKSNCGFVAELP